MQKHTIFIIILVIALILCIGFIVYLNNVKMKTIKQEAVLENIHARKSVRHFINNKEISNEQIEKILKAGMAAPSARNKQPWEFIVINDKMKLKSIAEKSPSGKMLANASCAIVVAGIQGSGEDKNEFWVQDTSAATENILLAIEAMKLGAVWIGVYPKHDRIAVVTNELSLPEYVMPLNIIAIGYPTGEDLPKDKWKPDKIHYNKF